MKRERIKNQEKIDEILTKGKILCEGIRAGLNNGKNIGALYEGHIFYIFVGHTTRYAEQLT